MLRGEDGTHEVKSYPRANSLIGRLGESMWSLPARQPVGLVGPGSRACTPVHAELSIPSSTTFLSRSSVNITSSD